jgi:hypothetical protein
VRLTRGRCIIIQLSVSRPSVQIGDSAVVVHSTGYVPRGSTREALDEFDQMGQQGGIKTCTIEDLLLMIETTARKEFIVELGLVPERPKDLFLPLVS